MSKSLDRFVSLFHRRWAVPVLAELKRGRGAKFSTLVNRLDVDRQTLGVTLDHLIDEGWVMRDPDHGHRPEYLLTPEGRRLAPGSARLLGTVQRLDIEPLAFNKWTMPVTYLLGQGPLRFSELQHELPPITSRALTLALKDLQQTHLVHRDVSEDYPPVTSYRLDRRAKPIWNALVALAKAV
ncbi:MAG: winged helix-turn-helix transcriptional regulator [Planctomycetota bacterium]|jgi:DNA-binding HxlR family transcriptional regulator